MLRTRPGLRRGTALAAAVLVLVLYDPWLARSYGFLLSVLATGALLTLAPVGPEGGVGSLTILGDITGGQSCLTGGAGRFLVTGFLGTL